MADNTIASPSGDVIRDLARQSGTIKTQVVQLDLGGASANAEVLITAGQQVMSASVPVVLASNQSAVPVSLASTTVTGSVAVTGTFFQATQPVSIASMPTTPVTGTFFQATQPVSGTFFQATQPVSAAALPLPTGASTETTLAALNTKLPAGTNSTTSGTLTASDAVVGVPDGNGTLLTGTSTAGSIVSIAVGDGLEAWTMLLNGYVSGAIYTEASNDSTNGTDGNWVVIKGRRTGTTPGVESVVYAMVASGYYRGNCAGFKYLRARLIGGTGATVQFMLSTGSGASFLNSGIPGGFSNIGTVGIDQSKPGISNGVQVNSDQGQLTMLTLILLELRVMNTVLHATLNARDDLDALRADAFNSGSNLIQ